ncbi:MAG: phosphotransferase [Patescibacteria group bacterium]|nr:phosphotransferase [Patescibacteria group bacterium]MDD4610929.1 phosphotransferase [Patescibacteria group bacterium]
MDLNKIAQAYNLGKIKNSTKLNGGINQTFSVTADKPQEKKYIFQKFNDALLDLCGTNRLMVAERWTENCEKVDSVLEGESFSTAKPLLQNKKFCYFENEEIWRVFEYIENDGENKQNEETIFQAGCALGRFHKIFQKNKLNTDYAIPHFHQALYYLKKLENLFKENSEKAKGVVLEFQFIRENIKNNLLPDNLSTFLLHGDPKLDNFLFKDEELVALIDLDAIMRGSNYLDIGDGLRSWCKIDYQFKNNLFVAGVEGYGEGYGEKIDQDLALRATKLITLELAVRYLIDYFEEIYFNWDRKKYKTAAEHNLFRVQKYIEYFNTIKL